MTDSAPIRMRLAKSLLRMTAALVGVYLAFVAFVWAIQGQLLYFPDRVHIAQLDKVGLGYEDVWLETDDRVRVHGWYVPAPEDRPAATLLYLHGNGGNISYLAYAFLEWRALGFESLAIDNRGY
ncbi:MAG: alpha/beta hydrolase, partial [Gemmatimonadota bacterium]